MRITPENITDLRENQIFVFGANSAGNHFGGAARLAHERFGAIMGQGEGLQGQSYGIDSMSGFSKFAISARAFQLFAEFNPHYDFYVTAVGCGIAGMKPSEVAPLFKDCLELENVYLPKSFIECLI